MSTGSPVQQIIEADHAIRALRRAGWRVEVASFNGGHRVTLRRGKSWVEARRSTVPAALAAAVEYGGGLARMTSWTEVTP